MKAQFPMPKAMVGDATGMLEEKSRSLFAEWQHEKV